MNYMDGPGLVLRCVVAMVTFLMEWLKGLLIVLRLVEGPSW